MANEPIRSERILCNGGLNTKDSSINLSVNGPGYATRLINYEVSQTDGYRTIDGSRPYDTTSTALPGTGATLGCWIFQDTVHAARSTTGSEYNIYRWVTGATWATAAVNIFATGSTDVRSSVGVSRLRVSKYNFEGKEAYTVTDGVNFPAAYNSADGWTVLTSADSTDVEGCSVTADFKNHLAYSGMSGTRANLVVFSSPNDPDGFTTGAGSLSVNVGFAVQTIGVFRDDLYIFGSDQIKKITGNNSSDFQLVDVTKNIGIVSRDALVTVGGDLIYYSPDGIRTVSGTDRIGDVELETISENIKSKLINYPELYDLSNVLGQVIRKKTQFRFYIFESSQQASESIGVIGGKRYASDGTSQWEFGDLLGIQANCTDSDFVNGVERVIFGGKDGVVYELERGDTSFNGSEKITVYDTPYLDFGDTETLKDLRRINLFISSEGQFSYFLGLNYAWDDPDYESPSNFSESITALSAIYDDPNVLYDDNTILYDGEGRFGRRTNIVGITPSVKFSFVTTGTTNKPFSIQGFVISMRDSEREVT